MRRKLSLMALCGFMIISVALCTLSCKSTGRTRADDIQSDLVDVQTGITEGTVHIDKTLVALNALTTEKADLTKPYEKYVDTLDDLESHAMSLRAESEDLRKRSQEYFEAWQRDTAKITNQELKKRSEERKEEIRSTYEEIEKIRVDSRTMFDAFLSNLKDIKQYLDTDLTPAGVQGIGNMIEQANKDGTNVKTRAKEINKIIEKVKEAVTSKLPPPPPTSEKKPAEETPAEEQPVKEEKSGT